MKEEFCSHCNKPPKRTAAHWYLVQIERLQEQNRLLAECLADERANRKAAYGWYQRRLSSRFWSMIDMFVMFRGVK